MPSEEKEGFLITRGLLSQFASTWRMLQQAIENCPDKYWYRTDKDWNFSRTIYHIIETQEFYIRSTPEGMVWGKLLGDLDNKTLSADEIYPAKDILLNYLEDLQKQINDYLITISINELLNKDGFKWFNSVFEKLLYLLRHNAHHLGELGRMLREWDSPRMKWQ